MFHESQYGESPEESYGLLLKQLRSLIEDEVDLVANLANASALLGQFLQDINWVGFYLLKGGELVLGPFQGLPACVRIPMGKGVCGTAAQSQSTMLVADVHQFPGHIACDAASNSEIVIPLYHSEELIGVLDIDSPLFSRFDENDKRYLEQFCEILSQHLAESARIRKN
ncbi:MAG: GAF domain-containing protein [Gorillibacterium sp.]|nr:GAF domain-containing protein [Gorillibacterium sp.]